MSFDVYEVASCAIYLILWAFILGALFLLCKDAIIGIKNKIVKRQRLQSMEEDWLNDRAAMSDAYYRQANGPVPLTQEEEEGLEMYGLTAGGDQDDFYSDEDIAAQYAMYLRNCDCVVSETYDHNDLSRRVLCQQCIPNCAEFLKVEKFGVDEPCSVCGHRNGEEFPDTNEEGQ